jgi:hypothetical protein
MCGCHGFVVSVVKNTVVEDGTIALGYEMLIALLI